MLQFFNKKRGQKGFTLIELLVVIAVIGMLASIVLVSLGPVRKKGRDARRMSDIRQINLAMEMCYPDSACGGLERYLATNAGANTVTAIGTYMPSVPKDPLTPTQDYTWTANASPYQYYCVYVKLEDEDDTWFCASNKGVLKKTATSYTPSNDDCCGPDLTP